MSTKTLSMKTLLEQLISENLVAPDVLTKIAETQTADTSGESSTPWYIRALVGFSAWFAAILFLIFLFGTEIIDFEEGAFIFGLILLVITTGVRWKFDQLFVNQLVLAFCLAGQFLFLFGIGEETESAELVAVVAVGLEIVLIFLYKDVVLRFLSTIFGFVAAIALFYVLEIPDALHLLVIVATLGTWLVWQHESGLATGKYVQLYKPVGYGLTLSLLGMLIPSFLPEVPVTTWWISTVVLFLVLFTLEYRILSFHEVALTHTTSIIVFVGTCILAIPLIMSPGIIAALFVLMLGFQRGNHILMGLALVFLAVFIFAFYYNLDLTLLAKSGILTASGMVLLGVRFFFARQFGKEAEHA